MGLEIKVDAALGGPSATLKMTMLFFLVLRVHWEGVCPLGIAAAASLTQLLLLRCSISCIHAVVAMTYYFFGIALVLGLQPT